MRAGDARGQVVFRTFDVALDIRNIGFGRHIGFDIGDATFEVYGATIELGELFLNAGTEVGEVGLGRYIMREAVLNDLDDGFSAGLREAVAGEFLDVAVSVKHGRVAHSDFPFVSM